MADAGLFIGFGVPVRGRERQATEVFNEAFEYYSRLQQEGEIESFEPVTWPCTRRAFMSWADPDARRDTYSRDTTVVVTWALGSR